MSDAGMSELSGIGAELERSVTVAAEASARALEAAFSEAGASIEASLSRAARRGQLDFQQMAEAISRDLARLAAQSLFSVPQAGPSQTFNLNVSGAATGTARSVIANQGALQAALMRAARGIGRMK